LLDLSSHRGYADKTLERELIVYHLLGRIMQPGIAAIYRQENDRGGNKRTGISKDVRRVGAKGVAFCLSSELFLWK
jgi:hypothetical protein